MANGSNIPAAGPTHLAFEKPIAKLENQIEELQLAHGDTTAAGKVAD